MSAQPVFVAFQANNDTISIIDAIRDDNPDATVHALPAMVKIDCPRRMVIRRDSIEALLGRAFDLRELQVNLISLAGNLDESEDEIVLEWKQENSR